jgi:GcrA cell cycle regulator
MADEERQAWRVAVGRRRFNWSGERIALLKQRWAEGLSASSIARELGPQVSRCAVLGKVHRLKLVQPAFKRQHPEKETAGRRRRPPRAQRAQRKPRARTQSRLTAAFEALGLGATFAAAEAAPRHAATAFGPACGLLELDAATCRWPVGDPGGPSFVFCGAAPFRRYPYCLAHCLIAYRPERRENEAPRAPSEQRLRAA